MRRARDRSLLRREGARGVRWDLADREARALDDGGPVLRCRVGHHLHVAPELLEQGHQDGALVVARRRGALRPRQGDGLGGLQVAHRRREGGERGLRRRERRVVGHPVHDARRVRDEVCHLGGQLE